MPIKWDSGFIMCLKASDSGFCLFCPTHIFSAFGRFKLCGIGVLAACWLAHCIELQRIVRLASLVYIL